MKKYRKFLWLLLIAGILIFARFYFLPLRHQIDKTVQGLQCRIGDSSYSEKVTVTIKGDYFEYLFKEDVFEGKISIDKYPYTSEMDLMPARFNNINTVLIYTIPGSSGMKPLGFLMTTPDFKNLLFGIYEDNPWTGENGLFICAPADNREQAISIAKTMTEKDKWQSSGFWK